ncbi:MAG: bifunctional demethylmenaquinone methyltransferase/2-methoxy-6-polyprenyl-1,4-benzoquinol methylase UbiE [Chthoniobacterales bacterium]
MNTPDTSVSGKAVSWQMFNRIAPTYDLLNTLLSGGCDARWRKKLYAELPASPNKLRLLDMATGTGEQLLALLRRDEKINRRIDSAVGLDPAEGMLSVAQKKVACSESLPCKEIRFVCSDACQTPFSDEEFHAITISFGIRNIPEPNRCLSEMLRLLKPGGRTLILEFSLPRNFFVRRFYLLYFRKILPFIGGVISGDSMAYRYLNQSVEEFPYDDAFLKLMRQAGFQNCRFQRLSLGIANIYVGEKA